jgi:hypothetical protein
MISQNIGDSFFKMPWRRISPGRDRHSLTLNFIERRWRRGGGHRHCKFEFFLPYSRCLPVGSGEDEGKFQT